MIRMPYHNSTLKTWMIKGLMNHIILRRIPLITPSPLLEETATIAMAAINEAMEVAEEVEAVVEVGAEEVW